MSAFPREPFKDHCSVCVEVVMENWPQNRIGKVTFCYDCSFKFGLVTEKEYCENGIRFIALPGKRAYYNQESGEIEIQLNNKKFDHELTQKKLRYTPRYISWRTKVFERDSYTCKKCFKIGGELNAHHIKSFKKFPRLRTQLDNGISLCEPCHKEVHRTKDPEFIKG